MKKIYLAFALAAAAILMLVVLTQSDTGRKKQNNTQTDTNTVTEDRHIEGLVNPVAGDYDSEDVASVVKVDLENRTISLRNLDTGKQYTLNYGGTSVLCDRNGVELTMAQVKVGDIVNVRFLKNEKSLTSLQESYIAFSYSSLRDFEISETGRSMVINGSTYKLTKQLVVVHDGNLIDLMDINPNDTLIVKGFDHSVYSIIIEKGHGYLRLQNDETFIGGYIEVGSEIIQVITENMLLTVPEGTYNVTVSNNGSGGTKSATIYANTETSLDVSDLVEVLPEGGVLFDVTPAYANIYVDGTKIDATEVITLTYGVHTVIIKADGYTTMTKYLRVGQDMATLTLELEKEVAASADSDDENNIDEDSQEERPEKGDNGSDTNSADNSENSSSDNNADSNTDNNAGSGDNNAGTGDNNTGTGDSGNTTGDNTSTSDNNSNEDTGNTAGDNGTGNNNDSQQTDDSSSNTATPEIETVSPSGSSDYYVSIEAPEGAEVYVDGNYVGLAPAKFKKTEGSHIVILRKNGYQTRSYTIELDNEQKDVSYSFSELEKID